MTHEFLHIYSVLRLSDYLVRMQSDNILRFTKMVNYLSCGFGVLFALVFASSETATSESGTFRDFINGISNTFEIAVLVDYSDGNLEKVKKFWSNIDAKYDGELTFGVIDGSGSETTINVDCLEEVGPMLKELKPSAKRNASSNDLFRYLLKTASLMAPESRVLLFTGRMTAEGPLQRACMDKLREKHSKLYVIWTGDSYDGIYAVRSLAEASNGSFEIADDVLKEPQISAQEETSREVIPKSVTLSKMVTSDSEGFGKIIGEITVDDDYKTINKSAKVRFPEAEPQEGDMDNPKVNVTLFSGKQQSRYAPLIPIRVEVSSRSSLESKPGTQQEIRYDVKNNLQAPVHLQFMVTQAQNLVIVKIQPQRYVLEPLGTVKVDVTYQSSTALAEGGEGTMLFAAATEFGTVIQLPTIITFKTTTTRDSWDPEITYSYQGDCKEHDKPDTCDMGAWRITATVKDETSGVKKVISEPYGLIFKTPFTAGTKLPVTVFYTASCCQPKIDLWAEDGHGNYVTRALDVNHQGLLLGEIAAVVLGVLLLICILIVIIGTIIIVKNRKQNKLIIPRYQGST